MEEHDKKDKATSSNWKKLVVIVIVAALVWGFISAVDVFIVNVLQSIFPTRSRVILSVYQITIYIVLLFLVIYLSDFDSNEFLTIA